MATESERLLVGAWLDAVGTSLSAIAETRELVGLNELNNRLVAIGEGLQAVGTLLIGTVTTDDALNFTGNWIDGAGAAASSLGSYLQDQDEENGERNIRLEMFGDFLQSMGASISAVADYQAGEIEYAKGNALQGVGAALEVIGTELDLKERVEGQPLITIGAILQAIGSNTNALVATREYQEEAGT
ncbi:DUF6944 family repetitive protein [Alkalihalobacterium alkalicellulosilyticum]|uniref:DUF6944 family repetitive protein n=1 Tax=Alkalihalobacterium alkalicellulosilyticum TaxID=1912214 RepID=UPI00099680F5|nr:hypothetical protein [Bacillus alkalicellulosilyticus]